LKYALTLEYDGGGFAGWQVQPHARTVAGELATALARLTGESPAVHAAGRTDAGAHSLGQVVSFELTRDWEPARLRSGLNAHLPEDVAVVEAGLVSGTFHARFSAIRRSYRYLVENRESRPALLRGHAWHVRRALDLEPMRAAGAALLGRHDLGAFGRDPGGRNTVRMLERLEVEPARAGVVGFELSADAFLYGMVRRIVGFLVAVGLGRRDAAEASALVVPGAVCTAPVAPAHGLYQLRPRYAEAIA